MKVIKKSYTPDGVQIQINDWSEDYSFFATNSEIAAYPKAKASSPYGWVRAGENFRCGFTFESEEQALKAFQQLESGEKRLEDFTDVLDLKLKRYLLGD